ncbi:cellulase family glycosylhydrolase [Demequina aestuarii]|uniref:cellulase family glycosylhydrolase n=1 Tax=Demequina aestuarii TaxID=327095 RepID=UPI000785938E|nr:cellulase family glycosylhydrolase [Demequina aestuarii]
MSDQTTPGDAADDQHADGEAAPTTPAQHEPSQARARRWPPTTRRGWVMIAGAAVGVLVLVVAGTWALAQSSRSDTSAGTSPTPSSTALADAATSASSCSAEVVVRDEWDGGFTADVVVHASAGALDSWSVMLELGDAVVDGAWSTTLMRGATGLVEAANLEYNGVVADGAETTFGFTASGTADAVSAACGGTVTTSPGDEDSDDVERAPGAAADVAPPSNAPSGDDWLSVDGSSIVDDDGNAVWLTGANWFGFNTSERVLHGLWSVNLESTIAAIAERGFNVLRVPISTELLLEWRSGDAPAADNVNTGTNPDLEGATTLEAFEALLVTSKAHGVKVILDVHSAKADNAGHNAPLWSAEGISTEDFMVAWEWVAERYRDDDTIVGFDLQNEPHGKPPEDPRATWGDGSDHDWRAVASEAAQRIHAAHPEALLLVEGIEATPADGEQWSSNDPGDYDITWWGGNLRLAGDQPVDGPADKVMYSPHDYGPLVYEQPWFRGTFSAASLEREVWGPTWLYLHDDGLSPLLIGEWGGRLGQDERQDRWMTYLRDLIVDRHLHHTFWVVNPNSSDTGGLLKDDWTTWDEEKYALVEPALWQDEDGAFVGLDHEVPLPGGVTVSEYYENGGSPPLD